MKIAVATADRENVNIHFGKAEIFLIYEFKDDEIELSEIRETKKDPNQKHQWYESLEIVKDCEVVICCQIGMKAKFGLDNVGIKVIKDEGPIKDVLKRFITHYKFMQTPF
jgi:predicted Fe-Mo cluster-binding NifX family protein